MQQAALYDTRVSLGLVMMLAACGCASSADAPTGGGDDAWPEGAMLAEPPADIPNALREQLVKLASDVARTLCARAARCCPSLSTSANRNCVDHAAFVWLYATRARQDEPNGQRSYAFDDDLAAQCRARLEALPEDCSFDNYIPDGDGAAALFGLQSACAGALQVSIDGRAPRQCWNDNDCIAVGAGLACQASVCKPRSEIGEACSGRAQGSCVDAGFCDGQVCQLRAELGQPCSSQGAACGAELSCEAGSCEAALQVGDACEGILACGVGKRCLPASEADPLGAGTCQAISSDGHLPCELDWQCSNECSGGYCDPRDHHFCSSPY